jgi:hypothetical protein
VGVSLLTKRPGHSVTSRGLKVSLREQARSHGIVGCLDISASSEDLWE